MEPSFPTSKIWRPLVQIPGEGICLATPIFKKRHDKWVFWVKARPELGRYEMVLDHGERGGLMCTVMTAQIHWHWIYFQGIGFSQSGKSLLVVPTQGKWERVFGQLDSIQLLEGVPNRWIFPQPTSNDDLA